MKLSILSFLFIAVFTLNSCNKGNDLDKSDQKETKDELKTCDLDGSKVADTAIWEEYIVEPLVTDEDCGCIVEGVVKYVKIDTDFAYVIYYGKGECDAWAYLVSYYGDDDKKTEKCKFELVCE